MGPDRDLGCLARLQRSALMPVPSMGGRGDPGALAGRVNHFFGNACPEQSDPPSAGEPGSLAEFTCAGSGEDAVQSEEPLGPRTAFPGQWRSRRSHRSHRWPGPFKTLADPRESVWVGGLFSLGWSLAERRGARVRDWTARGGFGGLDETAQAVCIPTQPRQPPGAAARLGLNLLQASAASPGPRRGAGGSFPPSAALLGRLCRGQRCPKARAG